MPQQSAEYLVLDNYRVYRFPELYRNRTRVEVWVYAVSECLPLQLYAVGELVVRPRPRSLASAL